MPRLCEFYPGICLTTEKKQVKTSVGVRETSVRLRKTSVRVTGFCGKVKSRRKKWTGNEWSKREKERAT